MVFRVLPKVSQIVILSLLIISFLVWKCHSLSQGQNDNEKTFDVDALRLSGYPVFLQIMVVFDWYKAEANLISLRSKSS